MPCKATYVRVNLIFWKWFLYLIGKTYFIKIFFNSWNKKYLVNLCPIFDNTEPSCHIKKNLWSCSMELEKPLNFTSLTLEFHNFNQALCRSFMIPVYQVLQILEESMVKINHDLKIPCQYHRNHVPYAFQILSYSIHIPME